MCLYVASQNFKTRLMQVFSISGRSRKSSAALEHVSRLGRKTLNRTHIDGGSVAVPLGTVDAEVAGGDSAIETIQ